MASEKQIYAVSVNNSSIKGNLTVTGTNKAHWLLLALGLVGLEAEARYQDTQEIYAEVIFNGEAFEVVFAEEKRAGHAE